MLNVLQCEGRLEKVSLLKVNEVNVNLLHFQVSNLTDLLNL